MNVVVTTISTDIMLRTLTNISTTIISTNSIYKWFINHNNNDYNIYKNKIISTDLNNKLLIIEALVKDIIKNYYLKEDDNVNEIINNFIKENEKFNEEQIEDFSLINHNDNLKIFFKIPEPLKISLLSNLEIINLINTDLNKIQNKINSHYNSYLSLLYSINIENEINNIYYNSQIFDKRISLLFNILNIYNTIK
jgi:hypothetical protein